MRTEKEFAEALKRGQDTIEVEGELAYKIIKIKETEEAAWDTCMDCIALATSLLVVTVGTAGIAAPVAGPAAALVLGAAVATWGMPTAIAATGIAVAGGGIEVLQRLRSYRMKIISNEKIILYRI